MRRSRYVGRDNDCAVPMRNLFAAGVPGAGHGDTAGQGNLSAGWSGIPVLLEYGW